MKKAKMTVLIASAFAVTMNLNGCVYGPPSSLETISSKDVVETSLKDVMETSAAEYSSSQTEEQYVFGHPSDFIEETGTETAQNTAPVSTATSDSQKDDPLFPGLIEVK